MPPPNQLHAPLGTGRGIPGHPGALEMEVPLPGHSANSVPGALRGELTHGLGWLQAGGWNSSCNQIFCVWLSQSGREGICVGAGAVPAALRGWTGDSGQPLCVTSCISPCIPPLWRGCFLPACHPFAEVVSFMEKRPVQSLFMRCCQSTGRVSETAWDGSRGFLEPHIKAG